MGKNRKIAARLLHSKRGHRRSDGERRLVKIESEPWVRTIDEYLRSEDSVHLRRRPHQEDDG